MKADICEHIDNLPKRPIDPPPPDNMHRTRQVPVPEQSTYWDHISSLEAVLTGAHQLPVFSGYQSAQSSCAPDARHAATDNRQRLSPTSRMPVHGAPHTAYSPEDELGLRTQAHVREHLEWRNTTREQEERKQSPHAQQQVRSLMPRMPPSVQRVQATDRHNVQPAAHPNVMHGKIPVAQLKSAAEEPDARQTVILRRATPRETKSLSACASLPMFGDSAEDSREEHRREPFVNPLPRMSSDATDATKTHPSLPSPPPQMMPPLPPAGATSKESPTRRHWAPPNQAHT